MFDQAATQLHTVRDLLRFAVSRFTEAGLSFGHGSDNAYDEAAYLILHTLKLPLDRLEPFLDARLVSDEVEQVLDVLARRANLRLPAAYLTQEAWLGDYRFFVDERVIVPRSFIAELLPEALAPWIEYPELVHRALDMCTGSGCLAILLADAYPDAEVDAVDLSADALDRAKAAGCLPMASVAEAADGAEAVVTMLPAGTHVEAVYGDLFAASLSPAAILIDCSTIDVATAKRVADLGCGYDAALARSIAADVARRRSPSRSVLKNWRSS